MHEKQAELNNNEAHLEVIKRNIRVANEELESVLNKKADAEKVSVYLLKTIKDENKVLENVVSRAKQEEYRRKELEDGFANFQKEIADKHFSFKEMMEKKNKKLEEKNNSIKDAINANEDRLEPLQNKLKSLESELLKAKQSIIEYDKQNKKAKGEFAKSRETANTEQARLDKLNSEVRAKEQNLSQLNQKIEQGWKEVEAPLATIKEKEKLQAVRERDFRILVRRAQGIIEKKLPNFKLNV